ncbi:MAG: tRNA pseudouridine(38-40) synthase TruA [Erysipelotrichaceae bacterium]|nr:tRNA pseudouridine(38-40) synthase TruA [Erysipelotrichaceae bacterium]
MRYKAIVSYDGTAYQGWQKQPDKNSVQAKIETALSRLCRQSVKITGAGRTDKGVHAFGQVFHFDTDKEFKDITKSINSQLPEDIRIVSCKPVSDEFHSRYDAKWKHYSYIINTGKFNPIQRNYAYQLGIDLDEEKMQEAAKALVGTHDFSSFNATRKDEIEDQVRTIYKIEVKRRGSLVTVDYYGDGFLRYMIRMMTGALIEAGKGKITAEDIQNIMGKMDKTACNYNVPACGLYLIEISYTNF